MFEGVLYFVLGFLCAVLIVLMVSPAIWNRAVLLTKKRIESSVPLSLNEIQADKDQLRAEFAMNIRRLEISVQKLNETVSIQTIEINRKRDELAKLSEERHTKNQSVEDLKAKLAKRQAALESANDNLKNTKEQLKAREQALEKIRLKLSQVQSDVDSYRIELVAKQTTIVGLGDEIKDLTTENQELVKQLQIVKKQLTEAETQIAGAKDSADMHLSTEHNENVLLRERINDLAAQVTAMTAALEGPGSPINSILDGAQKPDKSATKTAKVETLADRMRALQETARANKPDAINKIAER